MEKIRISREEIIAEYLSKDISYRELGSKYNIPFRSICDWVLEYQGRKKRWREKNQKNKLRLLLPEEPELPKEIKLLQAALRKSLLHNKLMDEIIRLAGEHTGIDLKKKFGTKRS